MGSHFSWPETGYRFQPRRELSGCRRDFRSRRIRGICAPVGCRTAVLACAAFRVAAPVASQALLPADHFFRKPSLQTAGELSRPDREKDQDRPKTFLRSQRAMLGALSRSRSCRVQRAAPPRRARKGSRGTGHQAGRVRRIAGWERSAQQRNSRSDRSDEAAAQFTRAPRGRHARRLGALRGVPRAMRASRIASRFVRRARTSSSITPLRTPTLARRWRTHLRCLPWRRWRRDFLR